MTVQMTPWLLVLVLGSACGSDTDGDCGDACASETTITYAARVDSVTTVYPAGDCNEKDNYQANYILGASDCADCFDYCTTSDGGLPCSWFSGTDYPNNGGEVDYITLSLEQPVSDGVELVVWTSFAIDPLLELAEVSVAPSTAETFTSLDNGNYDASCSLSRAALDQTVRYDLGAIDFAVGAVRIGVSSWEIGIDAVGVVSASP